MSRQINQRLRASSITGEVMTEISRQKEKAQAAEKAEGQKKNITGIQDVVFILSMLSCLILTGLNVTGKMPFRTVVDPVSASQAELLSYQTLNFAVRQIDAYVREHDRLPATLTEVGAPADSRWTYERLEGTRYRIEFRFEGYPLAYDSSSDPEVFFRKVRGGQ
jgi:hypothetical protein